MWIAGDGDRGRRLLRWDELSWRDATVPTDLEPYAVGATGAGEAWVVGDLGVVLRVGAASTLDQWLALPPVAVTP